MIYTAGYIGHKSSALLQLAIDLNAIVVDIRYSARSANPSYNHSALKRLLFDRYIHLPEWGNANYKTGPIWIPGFELGLTKFQRISGNTILLCACRDFETCHRKEIAERLGDTQEISDHQWFTAALGKDRPVQESLFG